MSLERRQAGRGPRALLRVALLALLALALLSGNLLGGSRYFFCSVMGEARSAPCCHRAPASTPRVEALDCACCHAQHVASLPDAVGARAIRVAIAAFAGLAPVALPGSMRVTEGVRGLLSIRPRAGPLRETDLTRLMVFRT